MKRILPHPLLRPISSARLLRNSHKRCEWSQQTKPPASKDLEAYCLSLARVVVVRSGQYMEDRGNQVLQEDNTKENGSDNVPLRHDMNQEDVYRP